MEKYTVVCDKFKLKFEVDDLSAIPKAINSLNRRLLMAEPYLLLSDFISEMGLPVEHYHPRYDEYGWNMVVTGLIEANVDFGMIDNKPILKLTFVTEPVGNFYEWY